MSGLDKIKMVKADLRQGYGVDDIQVRHGVDPAYSREIIRILDDQDDALDRLYDGMRFDMRSAADVAKVRNSQ